MNEVRTSFSDRLPPGTGDADIQSLWSWSGRVAHYAALWPAIDPECLGRSTGSRLYSVAPKIFTKEFCTKVKQYEKAGP